MVAYDTRCGIEAEAAGRRCHEMDLSGPSHMHLPLPCLSMHAVHVAHRSQCKRQCVGLVCPCPAFSAIWEIEPCRGSDSVASCALLRLLFVKAGGPLRSDIDPLPPHAHVNLVSGQITRLFPWSHLSLVMYVVAFFVLWLSFRTCAVASSSFRIPTQSRNACYGARYLPSTLLPQSQRTPLAANIRHKKPLLLPKSVMTRPR